MSVRELTLNRSGGIDVAQVFRNFSIKTGIFQPYNSHCCRALCSDLLHQFTRRLSLSLEWYFSCFNCISHQISRQLLSFYCHLRLVICFYTFWLALYARGIVHAFICNFSKVRKCVRSVDL